MSSDAHVTIDRCPTVAACARLQKKYGTSMEILLEFQGSHRPLTVTVSDAVAKVHDAAKEIADIDVEKYILQRFSEKWNGFVDVTKPNEIVDGDRVTLSPKQSPSLPAVCILKL